MMTAHDAMDIAIRLGNANDFEGGRFWLDIARELREGSAPGPETTMPVKARQQDTQSLRRPLARPGDAVEAIGNCSACGYAVKWTDDHMLIHTRTGLQTCPVSRPGPDDTITHTFAVLGDDTQVR